MAARAHTEMKTTAVTTPENTAGGRSVREENGPGGSRAPPGPPILTSAWLHSASQLQEDIGSC